MPMFSFVIPVYNSEEALKRCLDSVFAQTCNDYEVIVVDDCSPGNCKEIVDSYGGKVKYVRHEKNKSLLQARISGGRVAAGNYIVSLDSDDHVGAELLSVLKADAEENHSDVIVYQMGIERDGVVTPAWHNKPKCVMSASEMLNKLFSHETFWPMCGKAVSREKYLKALEWTGVDDNFYLNNTEDMFQMLPVLLNSKKVSFVEYLGYFYWQNPDSMTKSIGSYECLMPRAKQCQMCIDALRRAAKRHKASEDVMLGIRELITPTVKWFLQELRHLSTSELSRCVNMLCRIHGADVVLPLAQSVYDDFFAVFKPEKSLFPSPRQNAVQNVAVICFREHGGGAELATSIWMRQLKHLGLRFIWMPDRIYEKGAKFALDEDPAKRDAELRLYIQKENIDTVLFVDHWRNRMFMDLMTAKLAGCKTIVAEHSSYFFPLDDLNPALFLARENFYPLADVVTVLSPENVAWWHARGFSNVVYMPNFLTFEKGSPSKAKDWKDVRELLFVGRICDRKNANLVLEAFSILIQRHKDIQGKVRLSFLGRFNDDNIKASMETLKAKLSLGDEVAFMGNVNNVADYYKKADLLVVASRLEGAPMILMEAKSYGLPAVMFELPYVTGTNESDGVVTVPMGDTFAMSEAIYGLLTDKERHEKLSNAACGSLEGYGADAISARWSKLLSAVAEGRIPDELNPGCDPARMVDISMESVSSLAHVLSAQKLVVADSVEAQLQALRDERDDVWKRLDGAWKQYDAVCRERDEVWQRLDAAWKQQGVPEDYIQVQNQLRDMRSECDRLNAEVESLRSQCAKDGATQGDGAVAEANERRFLWKEGDFVRGCTWPFRMMKYTCRSLMKEGTAATGARIGRKFGNLFDRFFPR